MGRETGTDFKQCILQILHACDFQTEKVIITCTSSEFNELNAVNLDLLGLTLMSQ